MRKKLVATLFGAVALAPALATAPAACFPQGQCAFSWADYCGAVNPTPDAGLTCMGHLIDPYTWESGPIDASWMDFHHSYNITAHLRDAVTGQSIQGRLFEYVAYISPDPAPTKNGQQFTLAGGNLAVWYAQPDGVSVILRNDTCADYFVYFIVRAIPDGTEDAGPDGASQDAATDGASQDAATDGASQDATTD